MAQRVLMIDLATLAAGATSPLSDYVNGCDSITCRCTYNASATKPAIVHLVSSPDNVVYDTEDFASFEMPLDAGNQVQKTLLIDSGLVNIKAKVENPDPTYAITDIKVIAVKE